MTKGYNNYLYCIVTVSYTHLDVYKRQVNRRILLFWFQNFLLIFKKSFKNFTCPIRFFDSYLAGLVLHFQNNLLGWLSHHQTKPDFTSNSYYTQTYCYALLVVFAAVQLSPLKVCVLLKEVYACLLYTSRCV